MPKLSSTAIKAKIDQLQKQLKSLEAGKQPAVKKVRSLMKKLGVSIDDLRSAAESNPRGRPRKTNSTGAQQTNSVKKGGGKRGKVPAKFRDPASGNEWSGRGKTPVWLIEAEKTGRSRESFRI